MNLNMDGPTVDDLADRGRAAGAAMVQQFTQLRYPPHSPSATGWENHRWVRYRALLSSLPEWLVSYARGRQVLDIDPSAPPSYELTAAAGKLAEDLSEALDKVAGLVDRADDEALDELVASPRPLGAIRRIPLS
jgi:hypothetical protein